MSIFKEPFSQEVKTQLDKRINALKNRSVNDITYLNSRDAWVRMTSATNVEGYGDSLAKKYILQGGTLNENNTLKQGIGSSFDNSYSNTSAINQPYNLGIRPMPGITNISIKSKSAYGSLREATINFVCWDIKQLEDLELLYMRPGYTLLLEWGWSPYIDNKEVNKLIYTSNKFDIFDPSNYNQQDIAALNKRLFELSKSSGGNYEAMLGQIKNYSWKFRSDGGYDCTTVLISYGEVIESLKVNYTPSTLNFPTGSIVDGLIFPRQYFGNDPKAGDLKTYYQKNILSGVIYELYLYAKNATKQFDSSDKTKSRLIEGISITYGGEDFKPNFFVKKINIKGTTSANNDSSFIENDLQIYITLEGFFNLLNKYVFPQIKKENDSFPYIKLSTKDREYLGKGDQDLLCLAHPLQISTDPTICLINSPLWEKGFKFNGDESFNQQEQNLRDNIKGQYSYPQGSNDVSNLLNNLMKYGVDGNINSMSLEVFNSLAKIENINKQQFIKELLYQYEEKLTRKEDLIPNAGYTIQFYFNINGTEKNIYGGSFLSLNDALKKISGGFNLYNEINKYSFNNDNDKTQSLNLINQKGGIGYFSQKQELQQQKDLFNKTNQESVDKAKSGLKFLKNLEKKYINEENISLIKNGIIGNIYVNLSFLYSLSVNQNLESNDKKEKQNISIFDYLKNLMREIQSCIGNINNFEIHTDEKDNTIRVIDINFVTNDSIENIIDKTYEIPPQGLESLLKQISFESQMFQEQSAIISIAAQATPPVMGEDVSTLVAYNQGITNRLFPQVTTQAEIKKSAFTLDGRMVAIQKSISDISNYFNDLNSYFNDGWWFFNSKKISTFEVSKSAEYKNSLKDIIFTIKSFYKDNNKFKAIIPTKLSFTMDGIGGIVIGNLFRFPDRFMPKGYKGEQGIGRKLGYIVTELGHNIQNNVWDTNVTAQTIILENPNPNDTEFVYDSINLNPIDNTYQTNIPTENTPLSQVQTKTTDNGKLQDNELQELDPKYNYAIGSISSDEGRVRLKPQAMIALQNLLDLANQENIYLRINSAYRTYDDQVRVKAQYRNKAASPGRSNHGVGLAIDFANNDLTKVSVDMPEYKWLVKNANKFGFFRIKSEAWHWEYNSDINLGAFIDD